MKFLLLLFIFAQTANAASYFDNAVIEQNLTMSGKTASTVPYLDSSKNLVSSLVTPTELDNLTRIGSALGIASLDSAGKIPSTQLPNSVMEYQGAWSAATNTPTLADGVGNNGDVYRASSDGSVNFGHGAISFYNGDFAIYNGTLALWQRAPAADGVVSVNGFTGAVTLSASSPLTYSVGSFGCQTASGSQAGCLNSADWTTFNSKESVLTFSTGLTRSTNTVTSNLSTGVNGGQTLTFGTAASDNGTITSTSNSTKGKVYLGSAQASAFDEANGWLGIGTASPGRRLEVKGVGTTPQFRISETSGTPIGYDLAVDTVNGALTLTGMNIPGGSGNALLSFLTGAIAGNTFQLPAGGRSVALDNSSAKGRLFVAPAFTTVGMYSGGTEAITLTTSQQVGIGTTTASVTPAAMLHVSTVSAGNTGLIVQGVSAQSGSLLDLRDSSGASLSRFSATGGLLLNGIIQNIGSSTFYFQQNNSNSRMEFQNNGGYSNANQTAYIFAAGGNFTATSGDAVHTSIGSTTFAPTSGTSTYATLKLSSTINQTGTASGVSRGLLIDPTLTSAPDYRAIEVVNGNSIFGSTSGAVGIGASTLGAQLHVSTGSAANVGTLVRGVTSQSGDLAQWQDSTSTVRASITSAGTVKSQIFSPQTTGTWTFQNSNSASTLFQNNVSLTVANALVQFQQTGSWGLTSGDMTHFLIQSNFNPTSGTATAAGLMLTHTVNQTGGANGTTYGLKISPTLTSASDYRAIEMTNTSGIGISQTSSGAKNVFGGSINIGATASIANSLLQVKDGHLTSTQTTAPVATVNANAGTGATCSVSNATDTAGNISLTTTAVSPSAGAQCSIAFNKSYAVAPICMIMPTNNNSILFAVANGVYVTTSTSALVINYANADVTGHADTWGYHCIETQ